MKKYNVEISRTDEYEIHFDQEIWTSEYLAEWSKYFTDVEYLEDMAIHVAHSMISNGEDHGRHEGFGYIRIQRSNGHVLVFHRKNRETGEIEQVPDADFCDGLLVKIITSDDDYETNVNPIN